MAPPSEVTTPIIVPTSGLKYPAHRDAVNKNPDLWLKDRREDDGAEDLWRIHNTLYDFSSFVKRHPGGEEWLRITKGTDITEAFESHHFSPNPGRMLDKYVVTTATTPRNSKYTFHPDGFYMKLRERVNVIMSEISDRGPALKSRILIDSLLLTTFITAMFAARLQSTLLVMIAGVVLGMTTVMAHNFFHLRDNFRRYYFDVSGMSSTAWRISHALSHHLYPNTITDLEISFAEPFFYFLPSKDKTWAQRYLTWFTCPLVYCIIFFIEFGRRVISEGVRLTDLLPFTVTAAMLWCSPSGQEVNTLWLWVKLVIFGSFYFALVGFNAAHHHEDTFHEGDAVRENRDWGLAQLDAIRDRAEVCGVEGKLSTKSDGTMCVVIENYDASSIWTLFKVLTNFGNHALHHLFPTIDHAHLFRLYPALAETLNEFRVPFKTASISEHIAGKFVNLARIEPKLEPPETSEAEQSLIKQE